MNEEQITKYSILKEEIEKLNIRRLKKETRSNYKNRVLKFLRVLVENNITISAFRNINNKHLMEYGKIELEKGRSVNAIIQDIVAVKFFYDFQQNSHHAGRSRKIYLIDSKILKNYFMEWRKQNERI